MGIPHGLFNKSEQALKCLFWVTPTRKLYDLFWAIHSMKEQKPEEVVALSAKHEIVFRPQPPRGVRTGKPWPGWKRRKRMLKWIAIAGFACAIATSAEAMTPVPLPQ